MVIELENLKEKSLLISELEFYSIYLLFSFLSINIATLIYVAFNTAISTEFEIPNI